VRYIVLAKRIFGLPHTEIFPFGKFSKEIITAFTFVGAVFFAVSYLFFCISMVKCYWFNKKILSKARDCMKKIATWMAVIAIIVFVITWGIIGLKILDSNYVFTTEAYIGLISLLIFFICVLYVRSTSRCPHCGKIKQLFGKYCPYCGKEIN